MAHLKTLKNGSAYLLNIFRGNRNVRKMLIGVILATVFFLGVSAYLDMKAARHHGNMARKQFNDQQMLIARHIRRQVESELSFVGKELGRAGDILSRENGRIDSARPALEPLFSRLLEKSVFRVNILMLDQRQVHSFGYPRQWQIRVPEPDVLSSFRSPPETFGLFFSDPVHQSGNIHIQMAWQAADMNLIFIAELDISRFLGRFLDDVRSGSTGYAWVIDGKGIFLYHPYTRFIGKSAFSAREKRDTGLTHHAIAFIQENHMLTGHTGTGSYTAGWHRGLTGKIEKLIAYCPITIPGTIAGTWSVAVVAPVSEIDGYINQAAVWRFLLHAVILFVVVVSGTVLLVREIRWTSRLEDKVAQRTHDLQRSEEKYRSVVESAEDFIFTLDQDGRFQSMNSFTASFFGGRPDDFIHRSIDQVLNKESSQKHLKMQGLVFRHQKSVRDEFTLQAGEHELWVSANFMPIRNESGRVESVLCIARDITTEKNLERQLINTEKLASLGTLAAGVAHEINNPLGVILGFTDLLVRKTAKDSQAYEDLKTIERQGMHCKQIVENLLRFARFGEGNAASCVVNDAIREVVNIVHHTLDMEFIDLNMDLDDTIPVVRGDSRELQQVFLNLINNACAAMKQGDILTIHSRFISNENKAEIKIQDTGHGISPKHIDRIFEPFFTTKPEGEGTGLGLSVTYGIVSKYGGIIDCKSTPACFQNDANTAHGTLFTIKLPVFNKEI
ncbi:MAG: PAS domain S-box protein [Desulfotignum sp.]|nr:PAS domain S-box protein [Desulfotignum sp.]MCF8139058.1 PAS domain S-box protein [Desulfotignum sp.]